MFARIRDLLMSHVQLAGQLAAARQHVDVLSQSLNDALGELTSLREEHERFSSQFILTLRAICLKHCGRIELSPVFLEAAKAEGIMLMTERDEQTQAMIITIQAATPGEPSHLS